MKNLLLFLTAFFIRLLFDNVNAQITYLNSIESHGTQPAEMIISPDNKFAYVVARDNELQTYQRNPATGQLTYLSSDTQMTDGSQLYGMVTLAMSPDSKFIYTVGTFDGFIFRRDTATGLLTPFQKLTDNYFPLYYPTSNNNIVTSKNGKHVYMTGRKNVFVYERDSVTDSLILADTMQNLNDI
ncbi:MAG TPA: beta-propeller fold lactonase family protein, partial [Bacteroidia bacterium]|nr:beta-propeller fold lactonase family protein [Bacteroidia bacterium]